MKSSIPNACDTDSVFQMQTARFSLLGGWEGEPLHNLRICSSPHLEKFTPHSHIFVLPSLNNIFYIPIKTSFLAAVIAPWSISLAEHLLVLLTFQIIYQG